jgi:hypothetical protein
MSARNKTLLAIGKKLRGLDEDSTREPLPRRWVDLIHHLNEQERRRLEQQPEAEPCERPRSVN